jgi:hypothetical protein
LLSTRHSLRPLVLEGVIFAQLGRSSRRENADLCPLCHAPRTRGIQTPRFLRLSTSASGISPVKPGEDAGGMLFEIQIRPQIVGWAKRSVPTIVIAIV